MAFPVTKQLDLSYLGTEWNGAYLKFSGLSFAEARELAKNSDINTEDTKDTKNLDVVIKLIEDHFLQGKAWDGQALVEVQKEQLVDLPTDVITKSVELLAGTTSPNS